MAPVVFPKLPARGWHEPLIGAPYKDASEDPAGWDCWGLVRWCKAEHFGVEVPAYDAVRRRLSDLPPASRVDEKVSAFNAGLPAWRPLDAATPGAVVLMALAGRPVHVGLCLHGGLFLHVDRKIATCVESLTHPEWVRRIKGFYVCV